MEGHDCYEDYPLSTVIASNSLTISTLAIGAYILSDIGLIVAGPYLIYFAAMELNLWRSSCVNCYYYGKTCFSGSGRAAGLLFKRGDPKRMIEKKVTFAAILPDLLVTIFPLVGGIYLLLTGFSLLILSMMVALILLATVGNGFVRGKLACVHCKQRGLGCPAEQLFQRKGPQKN